MEFQILHLAIILGVAGAAVAMIVLLRRHR